MVGRRIKTGEKVESGRPFGRWELDVPRIYGIFARMDGWKAGDRSDARCTKFGAPPTAISNNGSAFWDYDEFWKGSYLYVPGKGEQRLLLRDPDNPHVPAPAANYPVVTANLWAVSCLSALKNPSTTTVPKIQGEGFLAIAPDGTKYYFDWYVRYSVQTLSKVGGAPQGAVTVSSRLLEQQQSGTLPQPGNESVVIGGTEPPKPIPVEPPTTDSAINATLPRDEVWLLASRVEDRYGNWVTYTYDPAKPRNLTRIESSDGRRLDLTYVPDALGSGEVIKTVSDGTRTWTYDYYNFPVPGSASTIFDLRKVTLPDSSSWSFPDSFHNLLHQVTFQNNGGCYDIPMFTAIDYTGSITHPSGATGTFTLRPTLHGRSKVQTGCFSTDTPPVVPRYFVTQSVINKTISGPGLNPLSWTIDYGDPNASWDTCANCPETKTVSVTNPENQVTRYTFGNHKDVNEGRLELTEAGWDGSSALQAVANRYRPYIGALEANTNPYPKYYGVGDPSNSGDSAMDSRPAPLDQRVVTRQGTSFAWEASAFDMYARPVEVTRSSSLGYTRTESTVYENNLVKWVLGAVKEVKDLGTGKILVSNQYYGTTADLESVSKFGKLQQKFTYNTDGTLASVADGKNQTSRFSSYKRGIAQRIDYADAKFETAVVNNIGKITSLTDAVSFTTTFDYDAAGRLKSIAYPVGDTVTWNGVAMPFGQVMQQEYDLAPGHWKQTITTGNATEVNYFDALWRPVLTERWDAANRNKTVRMTKRIYDSNGRVTFESYPKRSYAELGVGKISNYDALGRPTQTVIASELGNLSTSHSYESGFATTITDARGHAVTYSYQAFDEPVDTAITAISLPANASVTITRDVFGKPTSIMRSGAGGAVTRSYVYDSHERLCKTIEPETGATLQAYDDADNVVSRATGTNLSTAKACDVATVPASRLTTHQYDTRNRLIDTFFGDGSPAINRTYTPDGLPLTVNLNKAKWTYAYNKRRLLERESLVYGTTTYNIERKYDANGSLASLKYPGDTQELSYSPNALGEPAIVGTYATNITYHPNGAIAGFTYGNGIVRTMEQNARGLPMRSKDAGILNDVYNYDQNGNVLGIEDQQTGATTRVMTYDPLDRLETVSAPNLWGMATYGYDALDNLTSTVITGGPNTRSASHIIDPATNRLSSVSSANANFNFSYGYDVQGNITRRGNRNYVFDIANRMSSATGLATYEYDGHGRRVSVVGNDGVNRIQVYSQDGKLLYTTAGTGSSTKYIYLHNHVIAEVK